MAGKDNINSHNGIYNDHVKILQDISLKVTEVHTSVAHHSSRLVKIEDAIIQLAATQERVKALEDRITATANDLQLLSKEVWEEFKESRDNYIHCIDGRAATDQKVRAAEARIKNLEAFGDEFHKEHITDISSNTKFRRIGEKIFIGVAIIAVVWIGATLIGLSKPDPYSARFDTLETLIIEHMLDAEKGEYSLDLEDYNKGLPHEEKH